MFKMLAAVGAFEYESTPSFCSKNFLRYKVCSVTGSVNKVLKRAQAMQEIQQLRVQISNIAKCTMSRLSQPSDTQVRSPDFLVVH